ncbi:MAG: VRR-NUC domain-containing protein [Nanoarchaeota archaeon]
MKEKDLQKTIFDWLGYKKILAWRTNSGVFKTDKGGFYRAGVSGCGDITAVVNGQHIEIEVKVGKNKLSPNQLSWGEKIIGAGGKFIVVRSLEDLELELKNLEN